MAKRSTSFSRARASGFGLIDALVALGLLAITLMGACGSLHFALRGTRAAAWQSGAADLVADMAEDLHLPDPSTPPSARLDAWRARLQQQLPAARITVIHPHTVAAADLDIEFADLQIEWNGLPGQPAQSLRLPLARTPAP